MSDRPKVLHRIGVALNLRDPPTVPSYGWSYFDHMVAVYLTLNVNDPRAAAVIEKAAQRPYGLTWGDVFLMENITMSLQPVDVVCRNAWIVRERFREIAGPAIYGRYVASGIPTETDTPEKVSLLRADLSRILDFLHWYYALIPIREGRRKKLTIDCIGMVILYICALGGTLAYCRVHHHNFIAMAAWVVFAGIIGGFVSSQRRMQTIPADGDPLIGVFGLESAGYYLWLSPLLGGIFAAIITLLFMGGMLEGTVFPRFAEYAPGFYNYLPKDGVEFAKLLIWCFMAGFAERLVPDNLDRLASKLDPGKQAQTATATVDPPGSKVTQGSLAAAHDAAIAMGPHQPVTAETIGNALHTGETTEEAPAQEADTKTEPTTEKPPETKLDDKPAPKTEEKPSDSPVTKPIN